MKLNFYLASFIACFLAMPSFAQKKQNVYFLKDNGRYVNNRDSADFTRIVQEPDSGSTLYNVLDYYPNGNLKMLGKSSAIDPIQLEGQSVSYYSNKNKKRVCSYEKGMLTGDIFEFYPNGKIYCIYAYKKPTGKSSYAQLSENQFIQDAYDSTGVATVKDGNGHYQVFDNDHKLIEEEGDINDGKRNGTWKGTLNKGKVTFAEEYTDGKFMNGTRTNADGSTINYSIKEILPTFKGGESGFGSYLSRSIMYPPDAKRNHIQGKVIVSFVVETDGQLTDFKILRDVGGGCGQEAVRVLSKSPKWNPGLQRGVPVRVAYTMPINFALGN